MVIITGNYLYNYMNLRNENICNRKKLKECWMPVIWLRE